MVTEARSHVYHQRLQGPVFMCAPQGTLSHALYFIGLEYTGSASQRVLRDVHNGVFRIAAQFVLVSDRYGLAAMTYEPFFSDLGGPSFTTGRYMFRVWFVNHPEQAANTTFVVQGCGVEQTCDPRTSLYSPLSPAVPSHLALPLLLLSVSFLALSLSCCVSVSHVYTHSGVSSEPKPP